MFCYNCGCQINEKDTFCPYCGKNNKLINNIANNTYKSISITGFVLSFLIGIVGLILSLIGYRKSNAENQENYKKLSFAGFLISEITITWQITFISLFLGLYIIANM